MNRFLKIFSVIILTAASGANAQDVYNLTSPSYPSYSDLQYGYASAAIADTADSTGMGFPAPKSVLYKSLILPGWGQVVNKQIWKVPIVYALLGGLTGYSIYLTKKYHDYQAAFYNQNAIVDPDDEFPDDMRFGATPVYLQNANSASLRDNRNFFRNRRDFSYITIVLAYGLTAIDAYVFAHLRSFDVSEDLSMRPSIKPDLLAYRSPGLTLSLKLFKK